MGGCVEVNKPCLIKRSKDRWTEAGMPIKDDDRGIVAIIVKIKKKFDAKQNYERRGKLKEEAKEKFKTELENIAAINWRERILKDKSVRAEARHRKVSVLEDYIGYNSTRCWGWCWCWYWLWVWCWCWCWCRCWELGRGSRRGHGEQDGSSGAVVTLPEQWELPGSSGSTERVCQTCKRTIENINKEYHKNKNK